MLRNLTMFAAALAVGLGLSAIASAAGCSEKRDLGITALGAASDISGTAEKRSDGTRERFKVSMDARVSAGTTFAVYVNGSALAGTITIDNLGTGELDLSNENGRVLPAGVSPVCSISLVEVKDGAGGTVLSGTM